MSLIDFCVQLVIFETLGGLGVGIALCNDHNIGVGMAPIFMGVGFGCGVLASFGLIATAMILNKVWGNRTFTGWIAILLSITIYGSWSALSIWLSVVLDHALVHFLKPLSSH